MGRKPDLNRRQQAEELRAQGLLYREIGERLGVTRQQAHLLVTYQPPRIRCRDCGADLNPAGALPRDDRKVYCLPCLEQHPWASFGERLQAHRLAAGLKVRDLAERAGIDRSTVGAYEHGRTAASPQQQARLLAVLDVAVVVPPGPRRGRPPKAR
jgi:DNA-binding XRE family transcriptional regulator